MWDRIHCHENRAKTEATETEEEFMMIVPMSARMLVVVATSRPATIIVSRIAVRSRYRGYHRVRSLSTIYANRS